MVCCGSILAAHEAPCSSSGGRCKYVPVRSAPAVPGRRRPPKKNTAPRAAMLRRRAERRWASSLLKRRVAYPQSARGVAGAAGRRLPGPSARRDARRRAYRDVFTACPGKRLPVAPSPASKAKFTCTDSATIAWGSGSRVHPSAAITASPISEVEIAGPPPATSIVLYPSSSACITAAWIIAASSGCPSE
jgi:hypothetical protein